jgi:CheY-like chemotaxis protein
MLQRMLGEDVDLRVVLSPERPTIHIDPGQLEQVLMNLAVNSRDAMPRGGTLTIAVEARDLDEAFVASHHGTSVGRHALLEVMDTGIGMDEDTLGRVFEPFFTTKGRGTGLGLATVFGVVRQSGGTIWVESTPGHGTTVRLYFPLVAGVRADDGPEVVPDAESLRGRETILVVEDDELVRRVAEEILQRHGYRVLLARSAADALFLCEQNPSTIDMVLTDVVMPRMSGQQLVDRLALLRPEIRVLYMSGYAGGLVAEHGPLAQGAALVQKPLAPGDLLAHVRGVLDQREPPATP